MISIIAAMGQAHVIGFQGKLPWHLPADLRYFKAYTTGKTIVMGRKTFDSIGRPLPNRRNVVVTRQSDWAHVGCEVLHSLDALQAQHDTSEQVIIGGATLYQQALPWADRLLLTRIDAAFEGDTYFPEWDASVWQLSSSEAHQPDDKNPYAYRFEVYDRLSSDRKAP